MRGEGDEKACESCGIKGGDSDNKLLECGGCLTSYFCSTSCQLSSWKLHKKLCRQRKKSVIKIQSNWRGWYARRELQLSDGKPRCEVCGVSNSKEKQLHLCNGCKLSLYCSKTCQQFGWKRHKKVCRDRQKASLKIQFFWRKHHKQQEIIKCRTKIQSAWRRGLKKRATDRAIRNDIRVMSTRELCIVWTILVATLVCASVYFSERGRRVFIDTELRYAKTKYRKIMHRQMDILYLIELLTIDIVPLMQAEAVVALSDIDFQNYITDEEAQIISTRGIIPNLVQLLSSWNVEISEASTRVIEAICTSSSVSTFSDEVLAEGAIQPLILNTLQPARESHMIESLKTLSHCLMYNDIALSQLSQIKQVIPLFARILREFHDVEVIPDILAALSKITGEPTISELLKFGLANILIEYLDLDRGWIILGGVLTIFWKVGIHGTKAQKQTIIDAGFFRQVKGLLNHPFDNIRSLTCMALSDLLDSEDHVEMLFAMRGVLSKVIDLAMNDNQDIRTLAVELIMKFVHFGADEHITSIIEDGAMDIVCDFLLVERELDAYDLLGFVFHLEERHGKDYISTLSSSSSCIGAIQMNSWNDHMINTIIEKWESN